MTTATHSSSGDRLTSRTGSPVATSASQSRSGPSPRSASQLKKLKRDLRERFARSGSAAHDWVLRAQVRAFLDTLSAGQIRDFAMELDLENHRAELHQDSWKVALLREVLLAWGRKDPAAASLGFAESGRPVSPTAFEDWFRRNPDAARAWLETGGFPPGAEKIVDFYKRKLLDRDAAMDFPNALRLVGALQEREQEPLLQTWTREFALDPEKRAQLLGFLESHHDRDFAFTCLESLVREMAAKSPHEASEFVENSDFLEGVKDTLSGQVLGEWAKQAPQEAFAAWAELEQQEVPKPLLGALNNWSLNSPGAEQAVEWAMNLHPGPAREEVKVHLLTEMARMGRLEQAAQLSASLADPKNRIRQMKHVMRRFRDAHPPGALAWWRSLSTADQQALETPLE